MNKEKEIIELVKSVLKSDKIDERSSPENIENWDSLNHAIIIDKIEKHFNIKIELMEMLEIENVADIFKVVHQKTA